MDKKKTYFFTSKQGLVTHKEYIYVANYKYTHPEEVVYLCVHRPNEGKDLFEYLAAFSGIAILGWESVEVKNEERQLIKVEEITDENILSYSFFNSVEYMMRGITADMSILDLGCGDKAISNQFRVGKVTTVDSYEKFNPDILHNLNYALPFEKDSYDVAILLDVIEHLEKPRGFTLLEEIKRVVKKRFFVLTPLHWRENEEETNNPNSPYYHNSFNLHHSLWSPEDFKGFTRVHNPIMVDYFFGYWEKK